MYRTILFVALLAVHPLGAQVSSARARERALWGAGEAKPEIAFLGLFHFAGEKVDAETTPANLLPKMLSSKRQAEVRALRAMLIAWRPTKVVVECPAEDQGELDSILSPISRIHESTTQTRTSACRSPFLLRALGHRKVYAADASNPQIGTKFNDSVTA